MTGLLVLVLRLIAAAALYAFLGLALWIMWQNLRRSAAGHAAPSIRLEIKGRGHRPSARIFAQSEVTLGRDSSSDVRLYDKAVSARHARLSFHHGQWWVDDLGSTNGTRLNHEKLRVSTVLTSGDEIKCGSARILVSLPGRGGSEGTWHGGQDV